MGALEREVAGNGFCSAENGNGEGLCSVGNGKTCPHTGVEYGPIEKEIGAFGMKYRDSN